MSDTGKSGPLSGTAAMEVAVAPEARASAGGVTWRAVGLAFLLLLLFAPAGFYGELVFGTTYTFASGVPSMGALVALFLITLVNGLVRRSGRAGLSRTEVLTVYAIVLVGGPLMTHGIFAWMIGHNLAPQLVARAAAVANHFPHVHSLVVYRDQSGHGGGLFNGRGRCRGAIGRCRSRRGVLSPPRSSSPRCASCCSSATSGFPTSACPSRPRRFHWNSCKRTTPAAGPPPRMPRNPKFWIGFGVVFLIFAVDSISKFYPNFPGLPLTGKVLMNWIPVGPLAGLGEIQLYLDPTIIGLAFLIPKELSFSCWVFYLIRVVETIAAISLGAVPHAPEDWYDSTFPAPYYQGAGAAIALGLLVVWMGAYHLLRASGSPSPAGPDPQDPRSPASYAPSSSASSWPSRTW